MNIILAIAGFIADLKERFVPDSATVVASVLKLEVRLDAAIRKDNGRLLALRNAADAIAKQRAAADEAQNAAYKLLHKISTLTT